MFPPRPPVLWVRVVEWLIRLTVVRQNVGRVVGCIECATISYDRIGQAKRSQAL